MTGGDGFRPEFFAELARQERGHFWFQGRNRLILHVLKRSFPQLSSFLEVGCGTGFVLSGVAASFPAAALSGCEYFGEGLSFAAGRVPQASLYRLDARQLPFVAEFDVIGAFDVLEHIEEDEVVLQQFHRALRPGGGIVVTVPQHRWLWSAVDDDACHVRRYTRSELAAKVAAAGFRVDYATSFVSLLLPVMALSRLRRGGEGRPDPLAELRLPPLLNRLFGAVMALEGWLIRCGVRFPCGGSLLLVGRKVE